MISEREIGESNLYNPSAWLDQFRDRYTAEFGFHLSNRRVFIDDFRVRAEARSTTVAEPDKLSGTAASPIEHGDLFVNGEKFSAPIYRLDDLSSKFKTVGPALVMCGTSTTVVEPDWAMEIDIKGDIYLNRVQKPDETEEAEVVDKVDPVALSIFGHRFMSIAEQMGRVLQRTSISTNIKERLDFSCALFGPDGGLVSNAPHIPVHLGAMQQAVQYQLTASLDLSPGDVILSNHPIAGGSHLPDLTVITPVFHKDETTPHFFLANRGHHADIGGLTPGSMPPMSTHINEEGAIFKSFKILKKSEFQEEELTELFNAPAVHEGCSGSRNLADNIADLRAQIAANQRGITLVTDLIEEYTRPMVHKYMGWIQQAAEESVRQLLKATVKKLNKSKLHATDYMDDGSKIDLTVEINEKTGDAVFDFTKCDAEAFGNLNAPKAVTYSAVIYCLRCLIGYDVPLNQGCLNPVEIRLKRGTILFPSDEAAVVGGNVLTSQRVVDVVFKVCSLFNYHMID